MPRAPKILCVDDERLNRTIVRDMLAPHGYKIFEAEDGERALDLLRSESVDIILLDVNMPGMTGFEVCSYLKSRERFRNIPIIMLTALKETEDRIRGIEAGADDYITKPFNEGEVLARIRMLLKVKSLNEKLRDAYCTIKNLTAFGESIIQTFQPTDFDLLFSIDSIVSQLMRMNGESPSRPGTIILGVEEEGQCNFYRYSQVGGRVTREHMDLHQGSCAPASLQKDPGPIYFYNGEELVRSHFRDLVEHLEASGTPVRNMVTYASPSLSLYALNYSSDVSQYEAAVLESLVMQALFLKSLSEQVTETEDAFSYTVYSLARAAEAQDHDTGDHILRVGEYCSTIAEKLKLSDRFIRNIRLQATLHDIGKIHTSPAILKKPGRLSKEEWAEMQKHTLYGARIIGEHRRFEMGKSIALTHHEKWDGTGYPGGLAGEKIPVEGRIMAVADTYDALRTVRVYKPAFDHDDACRIILQGDDRTLPGHFDPEILGIFKKNKHLFEEIFERIGD